MTTITELTDWLVALGIPKDEGQLAESQGGTLRRYWKERDHPTWRFTNTGEDHETASAFLSVHPLVRTNESVYDYSSGSVCFRAGKNGVVDYVYFAEAYGGSILTDTLNIPESLPQLTDLFELFKEKWIEFELEMADATPEEDS